MATWPDSLPCFLADGYQEAPKSQSIESSVDAGPPKARRRFTAQYRTMSLNMNVTPEQADTFEDFFRDEAPDAVPFTLTHPRTGREVSCRITGDPPYTITLVGSGASHVNIAFTVQTTP